jgi:hydrogenase nickel incorporation protein HypA/HybF
MHEWALAEAVVTAASEIAEKERLKEVTEVRIRIGQLQQIDNEIFKFALEQLKTGKFKQAKFKIETAKATLKCRACNNKWFFSKEKLDQNMAEAIHFVPEIAHTYIKCPTCGSPDFEILEGRGVWLESIRGAK